MRTRKLFAAVAIAGACMMGAGSVTAYANVDEAAVAEAEAQAAETVSTEETAAETTAETETESEPVIDRSGATEDGTSFSVSGNGEVLDDISGDSTKEFYTIRTANNNTFYMVIDKSSTSENVYMLSMIDEDDLSEFLGETETETQASETTAVVIEENTQDTTETEAQETEDGSTEKKNVGGFVMIGIIAVLGIAAYYFFKIRPGKDEDDTPSENLEMDSGLEMVNEDEENDGEED